MTTLRKKLLPGHRKLQHVRSAVSAHYGNLYGLKLENVFIFNGNAAIARNEKTLSNFEERLQRLRNSRGSSAVHRARREAERKAGVAK